MDVKHASDLISENLTSIYGYAFARLYDKDKVDDLAGEIVTEILGSAEKIRDDGAFWAFAWRVADNTFKKFIRRESIIARAESQIDENAGDMGVYIPAESFEDELAEREEFDDELYRLRRELSLLSKTHREVSVMYYIKNMSCSEIAKAENISIDMVKYHLFKTRKLLKEGIGMNRNLGEKSYNPGTFVLNFWGDANYYNALFDRKLPGAIVLAAYYTPMTAQELSIETGVAMPYIEDELEILETAGIIKKNGDKYQTNIVIITDAYETEFEKNTKDMYPAVADKAFDDVKKLLPKIRALDFSWKDADDNRLIIMALNLAFVRGYQRATPNKKMPELPLGGHGYVHGFERDWSKNHFKGVTLGTRFEDKKTFYAHVGYSVLGRPNYFRVGNWSDKQKAMYDAIREAPINDNENAPYLIESGYIKSDGEHYHANFPVFKKSSFDALIEILSPVSEDVCVLIKEITSVATEMLIEHSPASVKDQCADIVANCYSQDVMAILMEDLVTRGKLSVPDGNDAVTTWGIKD